VYQARYRATHGTPTAVGLWTFGVCILRVAFVALGVSAVIREQWALALFAYAVPASIVTAIVRSREIRRLP